MSSLSSLDLSFLIMENKSRPMHMTGYQIFEKPKGSSEDFVTDLLGSFRDCEISAPFNNKVKWLNKGVASFSPVNTDMKYHLRHVAVTAPGGEEELSEIVTIINSELLDRAHPLWQCYVIEGLENNCFAILYKLHHSLCDGQGGLKMMRDCLSTSAKETVIRPIWASLAGVTDGEEKSNSKEKKSLWQSLIPQIKDLPTTVLNTALGATSMGLQMLNPDEKNIKLPFNAKVNQFNSSPTSSARRYSNTQFSLDKVKQISKKSGCTINDVMMSVIDHGLHHYLVAEEKESKDRLIALMAMSYRSEGGSASGNSAGVQIVPLGEADAEPLERLQQVAGSTKDVKKKSSVLSSSIKNIYSLMLLGSATLADFIPGLDALPSFNLIISNMKGPTEQLYLGGAKLIAFQGLPILPPGGGLNISFVSVHDKITLAIAATPDSVDNPYKLSGYISDGLDLLEQAVLENENNKQNPASVIEEVNTK